jgi:hypothetical protein
MLRGQRCRSRRRLLRLPAHGLVGAARQVRSSVLTWLLHAPFIKSAQGTPKDTTC